MSLACFPLKSAMMQALLSSRVHFFEHEEIHKKQGCHYVTDPQKVSGNNPPTRSCLHGLQCFYWRVKTECDLHWRSCNKNIMEVQMC